ncbi:uncharacterized protein [Procambarus clarkii]|uniref:uncharacterized protein n=1 Tax=Procambarus clarkii TaxID=6728 RepID=UPI0037441E41
MGSSTWRGSVVPFLLLFGLCYSASPKPLLDDLNIPSDFEGQGNISRARGQWMNLQGRNSAEDGEAWMENDELLFNEEVKNELSSRMARRKSFVPFNSLTFVTGNNDAGAFDWAATNISNIRQKIAGSKLAGKKPVSGEPSVESAPNFPVMASKAAVTRRSTAASNVPASVPYFHETAHTITEANTPTPEILDTSLVGTVTPSIQSYNYFTSPTEKGSTREVQTYIPFDVTRTKAGITTEASVLDPQLGTTENLSLVTWVPPPSTFLASEGSPSSIRYPSSRRPPGTRSPSGRPSTSWFSSSTLFPAITRSPTTTMLSSTKQPALATWFPPFTRLTVPKRTPSRTQPNPPDKRTSSTTPISNTRTPSAAGPFPTTKFPSLVKLSISTTYSTTKPWLSTWSSSSSRPPSTITLPPIIRPQLTTLSSTATIGSSTWPVPTAPWSVTTASERVSTWRPTQSQIIQLNDSQVKVQTFDSPTVATLATTFRPVQTTVKLHRNPSESFSAFGSQPHTSPAKGQITIANSQQHGNANFRPSASPRPMSTIDVDDSDHQLIQEVLGEITRTNDFSSLNQNINKGSHYPKHTAENINLGINLKNKEAEKNKISLLNNNDTVNQTSIHLTPSWATSLRPIGLKVHNTTSQPFMNASTDYTTPKTLWTILTTPKPTEALALESKFTRIPILQPVTEDEVREGVYTEVGNIQETETVASTSSPPAQEGSAGPDFEYDFYEDDLSEYYAAYGNVWDEHEEKIEGDRPHVLGPLPHEFPGLTTLTWPYTAALSSKPTHTQLNTPWMPGFNNNNLVPQIYIDDYGISPQTTDLEDSQESAISFYPISTSLVTLPSLSEPPEPHTLPSTDNSLTFEEYNYYSMHDNYSQSLNKDYYGHQTLSNYDDVTNQGEELTLGGVEELTLGGVEEYTLGVVEALLQLVLGPEATLGHHPPASPLVHTPTSDSMPHLLFNTKLGNVDVTQSDLNLNPIWRPHYKGPHVSQSQLEKIEVQLQNNVNNLDVRKTGFLEGNMVSASTPAATVSRQPPALYISPVNDGGVLGHPKPQSQGAKLPESHFNTFDFLNPLRPEQSSYVPNRMVGREALASKNRPDTLSSSNDDNYWRPVTSPVVDGRPTNAGENGSEATVPHVAVKVWEFVDGQLTLVATSRLPTSAFIQTGAPHDIPAQTPSTGATPQADSGAFQSLLSSATQLFPPVVSHLTPAHPDGHVSHHPGHFGQGTPTIQQLLENYKLQQLINSLQSASKEKLHALIQEIMDQQEFEGEDRWLLHQHRQLLISYLESLYNLPKPQYSQLQQQYMQHQPQHRQKQQQQEPSLQSVSSTHAALQQVSSTDAAHQEVYMLIPPHVNNLHNYNTYFQGIKPNPARLNPSLNSPTSLLRPGLEPFRSEPSAPLPHQNPPVLQFSPLLYNLLLNNNNLAPVQSISQPTLPQFGFNLWKNSQIPSNWQQSQSRPHVNSLPLGDFSSSHLQVPVIGLPGDYNIASVSSQYTSQMPERLYFSPDTQSLSGNSDIFSGLKKESLHDIPYVNMKPEPDRLAGVLSHGFSTITGTQDDAARPGVSPPSYINQSEAPLHVQQFLAPVPGSDDLHRNNFLQNPEDSQKTSIPGYFPHNISLSVTENGSVTLHVSDNLTYLTTDVKSSSTKRYGLFNSTSVTFIGNTTSALPHDTDSIYTSTFSSAGIAESLATSFRPNYNAPSVESNTFHHLPAVNNSGIVDNYHPLYQFNVPRPVYHQYAPRETTVTRTQTTTLPLYPYEGVGNPAALGSPVSQHSSSSGIVAATGSRPPQHLFPYVFSAENSAFQDYPVTVGAELSNGSPESFVSLKNNSSIFPDRSEWSSVSTSSEMNSQQYGGSSPHIDGSLSSVVASVWKELQRLQTFKTLFSDMDINDPIILGVIESLVLQSIRTIDPQLLDALEQGEEELRHQNDVLPFPVAHMPLVATGPPHQINNIRNQHWFHSAIPKYNETLHVDISNASYFDTSVDAHEFHHTEPTEYDQVRIESTKTMNESYPSVVPLLQGTNEDIPQALVYLQDAFEEHLAPSLSPLTAGSGPEPSHHTLTNPPSSPITPQTTSPTSFNQERLDAIGENIQDTPEPEDNVGMCLKTKWCAVGLALTVAMGATGAMAVPLVVPVLGRKRRDTASSVPLEDATFHLLPSYEPNVNLYEALVRGAIHNSASSTDENNEYQQNTGQASRISDDYASELIEPVLPQLHFRPLEVVDAAAASSAIVSALVNVEQNDDPVTENQEDEKRAVKKKKKKPAAESVGCLSSPTCYMPVVLTMLALVGPILSRGRRRRQVADGVQTDHVIAQNINSFISESGGYLETLQSAADQK